MNLVDEQDGLRILLQLAKQGLEALLEIATVLGACQQGAEIQGIDHVAPENVRHLLFHNHSGKAFNDGSLADTRFPYQQGIVLASSRQHLNDPGDFLIPANQRIDLAQQGLLVQVGGKTLQSTGRAFRRFFLIVPRLGRLWLPVMARHFGGAVGDVIDHIDACNVLLAQKVYSMTFLLAENCDQHIGTGHFALAGRLHVEHRALQHTLESQRRLCLPALFRFRDHGGGGIDELGEFRAQAGNIGPTGKQHIRGNFVVQERKEQMLHRHVFMTLLAGSRKGAVQSDFKIFAQHDSVFRLSVHFHIAKQRLFTFSRIVIDLLRFGFRDVLAEHSTYRLALSMHLQHDLRRLLHVHGKERTQDIYHEVHRSVVIIEQHNFVQWWLCKFGADRGCCKAAVAFFSRAGVPFPHCQLSLFWRV